ncbi:hypothetical protein F2Q68_00030396 [Brassica cretica]|uniref:Zinc knuckle CX2CX4HX4C domain-containing protein n=1 Tax=Brassica cretica TaxID=69181 RepID=A0A8S9GAP0_BRACR|nr:hypothetical protein F2Q68_00030396 [Brassica cretica]
MSIWFAVEKHNRFALERWEPFTSENFPNTIPFWIGVTGVPVHFWNYKTFTKIANALGKKLLIDEKKARIQVSTEADKPLQFERRISFPNRDIGKVSLVYEGLHQYYFTCNLISHDENTCPQLTPVEREAKRRQRAESHGINDHTRLPIQGSQAYNSNSRNPLKRPRYPSNGRHLSPLATSRSNELLREDKRRKNSSASSTAREVRKPDYQPRDHRSSSRHDTRSHQGKEVWSRLEILNNWDEARGRNNERHHPRNTHRHVALRQRNSSTTEWRPRRNNEVPTNRASEARVPRHALPDPTERSQATYDSQRTISDTRASLESGEINAFHSQSRNVAAVSAETET